MTMTGWPRDGRSVLCWNVGVVPRTTKGPEPLSRLSPSRSGQSIGRNGSDPRPNSAVRKTPKTESGAARGMQRQFWGESAVAVLFLRFSISQMDVPTRQSYTMAVVAPDERSAAAGVTNIARTVGAALAPMVAGPPYAAPALARLPFLLAGGLKIVYDALLWRSFRAVKPPEERG